MKQTKKSDFTSLFTSLSSLSLSAANLDQWAVSRAASYDLCLGYSEKAEQWCGGSAVKQGQLEKHICGWIRLIPVMLREMSPSSRSKPEHNHGLPGTLDGLLTLGPLLKKINKRVYARLCSHDCWDHVTCVHICRCAYVALCNPSIKLSIHQPTCLSVMCFFLTNLVLL